MPVFKDEERNTFYVKTYKAPYDLYIEDMNHRLRENSIGGKKNVFKNRILPYFKDKPANQITAKKSH